MGAISEADMVAALGAFEIVIRQMGYPFEERSRRERGARRFRQDWEERAPIGNGSIASRARPVRRGERSEPRGGRQSWTADGHVRCWQILLQKSAITVREDCLDLLTRLPTMPLFGER